MISKYKSLKDYSEQILYKWEKQLQADLLDTRRKKFKEINKHVRLQFECARDNGFIVHEINLQMWAMEKNESLGDDAVANFVASRHWLRNFKTANRIRKRKITKTVSRLNFQSAGEKLTAACEFRQRIRSLHDILFEDQYIFNTDQSGFEKEMHQHHTLEFRGTQQVSAVVQSVSATTHSYTIQPTFSMSGRLLKPLLVIMQEVGGKFGPQVQQKMFKSDELYVVATSSGKITKEIMKKWFSDVFLAHVGNDTLLLVDSLATYKDIIQVSNDLGNQQ